MYGFWISPLVGYAPAQSDTSICAESEHTSDNYAPELHGEFSPNSIIMGHFIHLTAGRAATTNDRQMQVEGLLLVKLIQLEVTVFSSLM